MGDDFADEYQTGLGRLLSACGFERVSGAHEEVRSPMPGPSIAFTGLTDAGFPILTASLPCAAYYIADEMRKAMRDSGEAAVTVQRIGDTYFATDVTEALHAAGCTIEERPDGVTIHLPNASGSVDGVQILRMLDPRPLRAEDLAMPDLKRERRRSGPDYLKHDPTKRRRNRRKW